MDTIPFDEIISGASARLTVIEDVQYLSVRDVIMHIGGHSAKTANKTWEKLSDSRKEEVTNAIRIFKFPGQGQSEQPVITFQGVLRLIMWIGGENAKKYRSTMVSILQRYYAGDGSLTDEIEANARSSAPIAQMARAALANEAGGGGAQEHDEITLPHKRKLQELEVARQEVELAKVNLAIEILKRDSKWEHTVKRRGEYRELCLDKVMDERALLLFKDEILNAVMLSAPARPLLTDGQEEQQQPQQQQPNNRPVSLSMVAVEIGMKILPNELISIGMELKKRYVEKHDKEPSKHDQLCGGRMTKVNSYTEDDRPLIEEVLRWHAGGRGV